MLFLFLALFLFCMSLIGLILKKNFLSIFINLNIMVSTSIFIFYLFLKKSSILMLDYHFVFFSTVSLAQFVIGLILINKYFDQEKTINVKD